jgi:hypothetical protein
MRELQELRAHLKAGREIKFNETDKKDVLGKLWMLTDDDDKVVAKNATKEFTRHIALEAEVDIPEITGTMTGRFQCKSNIESVRRV